MHSAIKKKVTINNLILGTSIAFYSKQCAKNYRGQLIKKGKKIIHLNVFQGAYNSL
jgi:hypothetical protein